jgi:hypothetical protein
VTVGEARESLSRFIASHFRNAGPHARFSIPTDCRRDDDMLMSAFICQAERAFQEVERLKLLVNTARDELLNRWGYGRCPCNVAPCDHDDMGLAVMKLLPSQATAQVTMPDDDPTALRADNQRLREQLEALKGAAE